MRFLVVAALAMLPAVANAQTFTVGSDSLASGWPSESIFNGAGCTGGNLSPDVHWSGAPADTGVYRVTIFDPDGGISGWWHWIVMDIPVDVTGLPRGAGDKSGKNLPATARHGMNSFGDVAYSGPCPPVGDKPHSYVITVYADPAPRTYAATGLWPGLRPGDAEKLAAGQELAPLATAKMTVTYGRK